MTVTETIINLAVAKSTVDFEKRKGALIGITTEGTGSQKRRVQAPRQNTFGGKWFMGQSSSTNADRSQERIIHETFKARGYGVELRIRDFPEFCWHEFNRAIYNLRHRDDLNIPKPRMESVVVEGRRLTVAYYQLLPGKWSERESDAAPQKPRRSYVAGAPPKPWEQVCAEREAKIRQPESFELRP